LLQLTGPPIPVLQSSGSLGAARQLSVSFDQNLSRRLVGLLAAEYPGSEHVEGAGLLGADDLTVWNYAAGRGLMVVSKDSDFRHLALLHSPPPKVIWLRVGNGPTAAVAALLRARVADVQAFAADPALALLVLP
jgi:predicted nuclease of predicted toxin-antitoxin system